MVAVVCQPHRSRSRPDEAVAMAAVTWVVVVILLSGLRSGGVAVMAGAMVAPG